MVRNEDFDNLTLNGDAVATGTDLSSHTGDTTNPHNVTASQANALPDTGGTVDGTIDLNGTGRIANIQPSSPDGGLQWILDSTVSGEHWGKVQFDDANGNVIYWTRNSEQGDAFRVRNNTTSSDLFNVNDNGDAEVMAGDLSVSGSTTVGDNSEISESAAGSTVIQNTAGNPINIQLSPSGRAFLSGNATETVIDTQDQWYEISGTWQDAHMNFLSHDGTGGMTYDGDVTTQIAYDVGGSYSSPDQNATYEIAVFKDGSIKPNTPVEFSPPRSGEVLSLPPIHGFTDSTTSGMRHSIRIRCTSGATNITIPALSFRIKG